MAETFEAYRARVLSYLGDEEPIGVQRATPSQLDRRLRDVAPQDLIRRPAHEKWSIAEIVAHLADAELAMGWRLRNMLANFTNTTGDTVFDGTLRQGLAAQLEQSPYLNIVSDDKIGGTLKLMGLAADARLTRDVSRQVCERTSSAAVIDGSIASIGGRYVVGLNAVNCKTGETIGH